MKFCGGQRQQTAAWYGQEKPVLDDDQSEVSAALLTLLRGDAGQRALIAWHMGWQPAQEAAGTEWMAPFLGQTLDDSYDAVRFIAARSLRGLPGYAEFKYEFVGLAFERAQAPQRTVDLWTKRRDAAGPWDPATLINADGSMMKDRIQKLLDQQDRSRVFLAE